MSGRRKRMGWMVLSVWLAAPLAWCDEAADSRSATTGDEKPRAVPRVCHGRMLTGSAGPCVHGSRREWLVRGYESIERIST